ncbi:hypothetical protein JIG36_00330 [Actinoplanes sp. LDG1-06]|uniref:Uncharacterized protein n=1 Tax=Paractinoplanes ovalisporus TaxID=2810368 RepID=A0ABS2A435_9ACTN|nr:hypothetical protein [Actinoplanes ovalisporus]MBM2614001.1 hypothetical protein [Actinoplanes ovalisporus]
MSALALARTAYLDPATGTLRGGPTGHGESHVDLESFVLPSARMTLNALASWGVADGLAVRAQPGATTVTVSTGTAFDRNGHLVSLGAGGSAVVDPDVDPNQVANVPTVLVSEQGVGLSTAGLSGERLLTLTWREVFDDTLLGNAPMLVHAPWLRLLAPADVPTGSSQVVLATVTLDANGGVTALSADRRRVTGASLSLRRATAAGPPLAVDQTEAATVSAGKDGTVALGPGLEFHDRNESAFGWTLYGSDHKARLLANGSERLSVSAVASDQVGLDVVRRMRVSQETGGPSAGIWFHRSAPARDEAFVGLDDEGRIGFWGNTGSGWGLLMDSGTGALTFRGDYGTPWGPASLSLWGSRIGDVGNGTLFIRSGGAVVAFDGDDNVGIGTASPQFPLDVRGAGTAIHGHGADKPFAAGVYATGRMGMWSNADQVGIMAVGRNTAVLGISSGTAGQFFGNVSITGNLNKGGGGFRIDHPDDPGGRYLTHSFVEAPERLNLYRGTVTTDGSGTATVTLPGYFAALNRDVTCQLTVVGEPALASVGGAGDNTFTVRTDRPGVTVSWLVLGARRDAWAEANPLTVEEDKPDGERDFYLHPEVHRQAEDRGMAYARHGDAMRRLREPS